MMKTLFFILLFLVLQGSGTQAFWWLGDKEDSPENLAPTSLDDAYDTTTNTNLSISANGVLANDTDANGNKMYAVLVSNPSNGVVKMSPDGSFEYKPNPEFSGTDSFTYKATNGTLAGNLATVTINVGGASGLLTQYLWKDVPSAKIENLTSHLNYPDNPNWKNTLTQFSTVGIEEGIDYGQKVFGYLSPTATGTHDYTFYLAASNRAELFLSPDDKAENKVSIGTSNKSQSPGRNMGTVSLTGGKRYYVEVVHKVGKPKADSMTLMWESSGAGIAREVIAGKNISHFSIANSAPVAVDDQYSVNQNQAFKQTAEGGLLKNDFDWEVERNPNLESLWVTPVSSASHGSLVINADGSFIYTPDADFKGSDTFSYTISDGQYSSNVAKVTLNVAFLNDAPVAIAEEYSLEKDEVLNTSSIAG